MGLRGAAGRDRGSGVSLSFPLAVIVPRGLGSSAFEKAEQALPTLPGGAGAGDLLSSGRNRLFSPVFLKSSVCTHTFVLLYLT